MRIRKRPPFSSASLTSPTPPSLSLVSDPCLQIPPSGGRDGATDNGNGGGERGRKDAEELHQDGDLQVDPHGIREDPNKTSLQHPQPHLAKAGQVQVLKEEVKKEEEEERMVDWSKRWHAQVNSTKSSSSSGALVEELTLLQKRGSRDSGDKADGSSKMPKERKSKATKARGKAGATSVIGNNCTTGLYGIDNEGCNGGTAAAKEQDKGSSGAVINGTGSSGKRRRSPAVLMEGSRCSRVNGRGWRCCQQTLVGYSLCEHHLGKGRLRSMSSVRGQIGATTRPKKNAEGGGDAMTSAPCSAQEYDEKQKKQQQQFLGADNAAKEMKQAEDDDEEEETTGRRKRKKIGIVKARSISSLLDEVDHPVPSTAPPPKVALMPPLAGSEAMV